MSKRRMLSRQPSLLPLAVQAADMPNLARPPGFGNKEGKS